MHMFIKIRMRVWIYLINSVNMPMQIYKRITHLCLSLSFLKEKVQYMLTVDILRCKMNPNQF